MLNEVDGLGEVSSESRKQPARNSDRRKKPQKQDKLERICWTKLQSTANEIFNVGWRCEKGNKLPSTKYAAGRGEKESISASSFG